jgi:hypothetical protein
MPPRRGIHQALAARTPPIAPDHVGRRACLIEKDEAARVHGALPHPPAPAVLRNVWPVLLCCPERLLWNGPPLTSWLYNGGYSGGEDR